MTCATGRGIIPADAGNTFFTITSHFLHRDHPRGCGEHRPLTNGASPAGGSSLRMRGTPTCQYAESDV